MAADKNLGISRLLNDVEFLIIYITYVNSQV